MHSTPHYCLCGRVNDLPAALKLLLFVDADFAGESDNARSTSGGFLILAGPNTWFPLAWISKRQTSTSRSTTEAEIISLATSLFSEALPMLDLWDTLLGRHVQLVVMEDNQATMKIAKRGYSSKLRHVQRVHKVNISSIAEVLSSEEVSIEYCPTDLQSADVFTKALTPAKWDNALDLLGIRRDFRPAAKADKEQTVVGAPAPTEGSSPDSPSGGRVKPDQAGFLPTGCTGLVGVCTAIDSVVALANEFFEPPQAQALLEHSVELVGRVGATPAFPEGGRARPSGKLPSWGMLVEINAKDSTFSTAAADFKDTSYHRVAPSEIQERAGTEELKEFLRKHAGCSLHGCLPSIVWSPSQWERIQTDGPKYMDKLMRRRGHSLQLLSHFIECANVCMSLGGEVSFEWPSDSAGWIAEPLLHFAHQQQLHTVLVKGTKAILAKPPADDQGGASTTRFLCSSKRLAQSLSGKTWITTGLGQHPLPMCRTFLSATFGYEAGAPAMQCVPVTVHPHREHEVHLQDFAVSPGAPGGPPGAPGWMMDACGIEPPTLAAVTKLLDRKETFRNQKAMDAVTAEGQALVKAGTWLEDTVTEKDDVIANARKTGEKTHMGDLMTICSVKFWERAEEHHKYKGRICFRGDNVKDEYGAAAIFQELSASPTAVQTANANLAYGCLPGHKTTQADAIRAYIQSLLKSKHKTWVMVPKELWPQHWHKMGYRRPMCVLEKALYGHPESGGHWEAHLTKAVEACGGVAVQNHPSSFWFAEDKLLLSVYVDDLLLSGPESRHEPFWKKLRSGVNAIAIDDPEPLDRFLGRYHQPF